MKTFTNRFYVYIFGGQILVNMSAFLVLPCLLFGLCSGWTCPSVSTLSSNAPDNYNAAVVLIGKFDYDDIYAIKSPFDNLDHGTSCGVTTSDQAPIFAVLGKAVQIRWYHPQTTDQVKELMALYQNWPLIREMIDESIGDNQTLITSGSLVMVFNETLRPNAFTIGPANYSLNLTRFEPISLNTDFAPISSVYTDSDSDALSLTLTLGYHIIDFPSDSSEFNRIITDIFPGNSDYRKGNGIVPHPFESGTVMVTYYSLTNALDDVGSPLTWNGTFDKMWINGTYFEQWGEWIDGSVQYFNRTYDYVFYLYGIGVECVGTDKNGVTADDWCQMFVDGKYPK